MKRYIEGKSREQMVLMPESLDDFIGEDNPVRTCLLMNWICRDWGSRVHNLQSRDGRATILACFSSCTSTVI